MFKNTEKTVLISFPRSSTLLASVKVFITLLLPFPTHFEGSCTGLFKRYNVVSLALNYRKAVWT